VNAIADETKFTVMIVDDAPENIMVLDEILRADYKVKAANNGERALKIVLSEPPPDIVLLDILMPGMDGFEVCRRLKQDPRTQFIPVVMVTSLHALEDRVRALEAGADDFLTKPVEPSEVRARVRSLLRLKKMHDQLQSSYEQLQQLETMRENLTDMIVHDMRTPLTGIINGQMTVRMLLDIEAGTDADECQSIAENSAQTLLEMINGLLDITKMEAGEMKLNKQSVEPSAVIAAVEQSVRPLAKDGDLALQNAVSSALAPVSADAEMLRRILVNLAGNALKFTPPGGLVEIGAEDNEAETRFWVRDTGPGIPADYHSKIFEKFGQVESYTARKKLSTGLGLTFCKMAVEAHGGRIGLESTLEQGSTFFFTLPREASKN
jgi:two-component system sensor histidine kinase/response regulator